MGRWALSLLWLCLLGFAQLGRAEGSGEGLGPDLEDEVKEGVLELDPEQMAQDQQPSLLQLHIIPVRAEDEFFRGRVALTLWLHETWNDSRLARPNRKPVLLSPEDVSGLTHSPLAIKNALYYKAVATPRLHGRLTLYANGTVDSWRQVRIDAPCQLENRQAPSATFAQSRYRQPAYSSFLSRCDLRFGSFLRPHQSLALRWAPIAIDTKDFLCVGRGGAASRCSLQTTTTSRKTVRFAGHNFHVLVARLRFTHPT